MTAGETVLYTITISNSGTGAAGITQIQDVLPPGFSYISGTSSGITTNNPTITGQVLTWNGMWSVPAGENRILSFSAAATSITGTYYNNVSVYGTNFPAYNTGNIAPVNVGAPLMDIQKYSNKASAIPGEEITYTIHYRNTGYGSATFVIISDTIPFNTTYVPGSLRIGIAGSTYEIAIPLTDAADSDAGHVSGNTVIFNIGNVSANDGIPNSGTDEGKVYFKVKVN